MPELPLGSLPVPATPIDQLRRWQLEIRCSRCRRRVVLELAALAQRYDQRIRMGEVVRRLRCRGAMTNKICGGRPSQVKLVEVHTYGKSMRKLREVTVVGA